MMKIFGQGLVNIAKVKWYKYSIIIFILITLSILESCGVLFFRKNEPIARRCFFDPALRSIIYKKKNNEGIIRIEIELLSTEKNTTSSYFKKNYSDPIQHIDLSMMDTALLMQNLVDIKIWDQSPVIEDYTLTIKPSDWKQRKLVYSRYSTR